MTEKGTIDFLNSDDKEIAQALKAYAMANQFRTAVPEIIVASLKDPKRRAAFHGCVIAAWYIQEFEALYIMCKGIEKKPDFPDILPWAQEIFESGQIVHTVRTADTIHMYQGSKLYLPGTKSIADQLTNQIMHELHHEYPFSAN